MAINTWEYIHILAIYFYPECTVVFSRTVLKLGFITCSNAFNDHLSLCKGVCFLFYSLPAAFNVCEHPSLVDCHVNADCVDIVGDYECHCTTGYTGNGTHCTG